MEALFQKYHIQHRVTSPYHPQANGQVESTNKVVESIVTKTMKINHKDQVDRLPKELWAYCTTWRNNIGFSPCELVYGKSIVFPIEIEIKTMRKTMEENLDLTEAQKNQLNQLNELDEKSIIVVHHTTLIQQLRSKRHDRFIKKNMFCEGDWDLLYDSQFKRDFKGKLCTRWLGPYKIDQVFDNGTF